MPSPQILILDVENDPCSAGNCNRLPALIENEFPSGGVHLQTSLRPPGAGSIEPDLVVLRTPARLPLAQVLKPLRERWKLASMLAVICRSSQTACELLDSLLHGLDDFLCCPFRDLDLVPRVRRLLPRRASNSLAAPPLRLDMLVGESEAFLAAVHKVPCLAKSDATVLITGETGTGKELFARAVHYNGVRRGNPFIPVNCGALPDHLLENELFGHVRGAYTDASSAEKGLLAEAEGGSVFLDEVDTLSLSAQAKVLRFLQDREYKPLGCSRNLTADVRIIGATNADLRERMRAGLFREDLFHRLNVLTLRVPALRERASDISILANHFLSRYGLQYGRGRLTFSGATVRKLMAYSWPGNVRELEGLVHRAAVLSSSDLLHPEDLELPVAASVEAVEAGPLQAAKNRAVGEFERSYLSNLLTEHRGNVSRAARAAGKDRRALQRLIRKHGLDRQAFQVT